MGRIGGGVNGITQSGLFGDFGSSSDNSVEGNVEVKQHIIPAVIAAVVAAASAQLPRTWSSRPRQVTIINSQDPRASAAGEGRAIRLGRSHQGRDGCAAGQDRYLSKSEVAIFCSEANAAISRKISIRCSIRRLEERHRAAPLYDPRPASLRIRNRWLKAIQCPTGGRMTVASSRSRPAHRDRIGRKPKSNRRR